jgi:hypothetical protein
MGSKIRNDSGRPTWVIDVVTGRGGGLHLEKFPPKNDNSPRPALLLRDFGETVAGIIALDAKHVKERVHIFLDVPSLL